MRSHQVRSGTRQAAARHGGRRAGGDPWPLASATGPAAVATVLRIADGGSRRRLVEGLQVRHGNAEVARLLAGDRDARRRRGMVSTILADIATGIGEFLGIDPEGVRESQEGESAPATPTTSGTTINVSDAPFEVSGTFLEVAGELAGRTEAGSVTSHVSDIYLEPVPGPTRIASITVDETRSLPRWTDRGRASDSERREWDRFLAALTSHENRHVEIDRGVFSNLHRRCLRVMETTANARIDTAIEAADTANAEFDTATRNGRATGTVIDTAAAARSTAPEE